MDRRIRLRLASTVSFGPASRGGALALCLYAGLAQAQAQTLVDAVKSGDIGAVQALLAKTADVNAAQADGTTALHWAVEHDAVALVQALIRAGANVKAANRYGATPLW